MERAARFLDNRALNEQEFKSGKIILKSKPRTLMIVLSARCNLNCIMCPRPNSSYVLPPDFFRKVEPLLPYLESINWGGGGEVFFIEYFKDLFNKVSRWPDIRQDITTNGLLIDASWGRILAENKVNLSFSIDAVTEKLYEYIRRPASFANLIRSIECVNRYRANNENNIKLILNVVVMKCNYKELNLFPDFCNKYNFQQLRIEYLRPVIDPELDIFTVKKDSLAIRYLREIMPEIEQNCRDSGIKLESCIRPFLDSDTEVLINSNKLIYNCKLPWQKLLIDGSAKGMVFPDCLCPHPLGSILDHSIEELWNNDIMQQYRKNIVNQNVQGWCSERCLIYERTG